MLHTNNPIIKHKAGLLNLAEEPGQIAEVGIPANISSLYPFTSGAIIYGESECRGIDAVCQYCRFVDSDNWHQGTIYT